MSAYTYATVHRAESGHLTIDWETPGNVMPPWPVLIVPELLVEMIERFNESVPRGLE